MRTKLLSAYMNCKFIFNNGQAYEFYKNPKRRPTIIYLPPEELQELEWYKRNRKYFMTKKEFEDLWELQKQFNKPWSYGGEDELNNLKTAALMEE